MSGTKIVHKQLGKDLDYREISGKFGLGASISREKVNTLGTDKNLFRLVPVPGQGARVLPLELVPVPGQGAQISARGPTEGYVQTARAPSTKSERSQKPYSSGAFLASFYL